MRTFILTYDRNGNLDEKELEILNQELLKKIVELVILEGADGVIHPQGSTIIFTCANKYVYAHWKIVFEEFNKPTKMFFSLGEIYQGVTRHLEILTNLKLAKEDFDGLVKELLAKRTSIAVVKSV